MCEQEIRKLLERWEGKEGDTVEFDADLGDHKKIAFELEKILGTDLTKVPGLEARLLMQVISEIGTDMSRWPSDKHFVSWLGLCPDNKISGGKILDSRTRPVANKAAQALRMAANSLYRSKTFLGAFLRRMRARLGVAKAITATAHKLAIIIYTMIIEKKQFVEFGQDAYEQKHKDRAIAKLKRKAVELGFSIVPNQQNVPA